MDKDKLKEIWDGVKTPEEVNPAFLSKIFDTEPTVPF